MNKLNPKTLGVILFCSLLISCGFAFLPEPTKKTVTVADVVGRWQYKTHASNYPGEIEFFKSGDFAQKILIPGKPSKLQKGKWCLDGADIKLQGILSEDPSGGGTVEDISWWLIDNDAGSSPRFLIFGRDFNDPDAFEAMSLLPPKMQGTKP